MELLFFLAIMVLSISPLPRKYERFTRTFLSMCNCSQSVHVWMMSSSLQSTDCPKTAFISDSNSLLSNYHLRIWIICSYSALISLTGWLQCLLTFLFSMINTELSKTITNGSGMCYYKFRDTVMLRKLELNVFFFLLDSFCVNLTVN